MLRDKWVRLSLAAALAGLLPTYGKAAVTIYAGPSYTSGTGGAGGVSNQSMPQNPGVSVVLGGTAIARGTQYYPSTTGGTPTSGNGVSFIFTSSGSTPMQSIGTQPSGLPNSTGAYAVSGSGMVTGYIVNSTYATYTATRWDSSGNPTALAPLSYSTDSTSDSTGLGYAINYSGAVGGYSVQYSGTTSLGNRPVYWSTTSSAAIPLGIYNTGFNKYPSTNSYNTGSVQAINTNGTMVGEDEKYADSAGAGTGADIGAFASVWSTSNPSAAPVQLADIPGNGTYGGLAAAGSSSSTVYNSNVRVLNDVGTAGGTIIKYDSTQYATNGGQQGSRPVRWNTTLNTVQVLDVSGTTTSSGVTGYTTGDVLGINSLGDVVGKLNNYTSGGTSLGTLPELWRAGGTAITPLSLLGTSAAGASGGSANAINAGEYIVGNVNDYSTNGGDSFGTTGGQAVAALWGPDASVTDLSTLITTVASNSTSAGWVSLNNAYGITDDGWISGVGTYNPGGGLSTYTRAFLIQDTAAVPEPTGLTVVLTGASLLLKRRRNNKLAD